MRTETILGMRPDNPVLLMIDRFVTSRSTEYKTVERLASSGANAESVAKALGVSRSTFQKRMKRDRELRRSWERGVVAYAESVGKTTKREKNGKLIVYTPKISGADTNEKLQQGMESVLRYLHAFGERSFSEIKKAVKLSADDLSDVFRELILETGTVKARRVVGSDEFRYFVNPKTNYVQRPNKRKTSGLPQ